MPALLPDIDPDGLLEYSVVYSDRSLNHMSRAFQDVIKGISASLKQVYKADAVAVVPGGGTYGMEAVARQFATGKKCLVLRNGWFSYRWSQIFAAGGIPAEEIVLRARPVEEGDNPAWAPAPVEEVTAAIAKHKPDLVFAPHVETASGMMLPEDYLREVGEAVHNVGGMFVLDCIASGTVWVDMSIGVDVLISAPQKGWSSSPCAGLVMFSGQALKALEAGASTSFALDLKKWREIMAAYETGGHAYHATMPTDSLRRFHAIMEETTATGLDRVRDAQIELGQQARALLKSYGFKSLAAEGYGAPGVIVSYTGDPDIHTGRKFIELGLQTAAGVPLMCDEPENFRTFRIGLFGLDKLADIDGTVARLEEALKAATGNVS